MHGSDQLRTDGRMVVPAVSYAVLGFLWIEFARQFFDVMLPRVISVIHSGRIANTAPCISPDCDFSVFWPAGLLVRTGNFEGLYNAAQFLVWRHDVLFAGAQRLDWFYPPPTLLPAVAISYFPFDIAFFVWTFCLMAAAIFILRGARLSWTVIAVSLLSPAALLTLEMGQLEIFCGACAVAALLRINSAPSCAGALLGLLVFKPQAGLLAPLVPLLQRNRRAVIAGLVTVLGICGAVTALSGGKIWQIYFQFLPAVSRQNVTAAHPLGIDSGVSVLWMMRSFGLGLGISYAVQCAAAALAAGLIWKLWQRPKFCQTERIALTVFLSLLATPYGYVDDMVAYSIALTMLAQARGWRIDVLDVLLWLWPALCPVVFDKTGILLTPLVIAIAIARTWQRAGMAVVHLPRGAAVLPRA